ncbi:MAG: hypothetical protein J1F36_03175 [Clostridiales bacterium]|nr:hypothetical protein [Clostridiales bacterium]
MNILTFLKNKLNGNATSSTSSSSSSSDKLKELESFVKNQYENYLPSKSATTPDVPSYERYEYEAPSDEQIKKSAETELGDYVLSGENSIRDEYAQKAKELEANKASSEKQYVDSSQKLKSAYDEAAEALSNDSLKRGLARSSIALNNQAAATQAYTQNVNSLIEQRNQKIAEIDEELNSLDGQLQSALNSFKIGYAAKLTERINELKAEREKNKQEAIKYNNSLLKDEYEQSINKQKTDSDLYSKALSQKQREEAIKDSLSAEDKSKIEKSIYDKVVEVLDSMSFDDAKELFNSEPIFRNILSDYYYYTLYYKYR